MKKTVKTGLIKISLCKNILNRRKISRGKNNNFGMVYEPQTTQKWSSFIIVLIYGDLLFSYFYRVSLSKRFFEPRSSHFTFGSGCTVYCLGNFFSLNYRTPINMAAVLTVVNNSTAVRNGFYRPRFTMNVKGLDTRKKTLNLESNLHSSNCITKTSIHQPINYTWKLETLNNSWTSWLGRTPTSKISFPSSTKLWRIQNTKTHSFHIPVWAVESALWSRKERHAHWRRIRQVWYWV